jgi:DNA-binding CsgD family transcriptional regulator
VRKTSIDTKALKEAAQRLSDAAVDPYVWPEIMEQVSAAVRATGAGLLQSDVRTADIPRTKGVSDLVNNYFTAGWHTRDLRGQRGVPMLLRGDKVFVDQDVVTPAEMKRSPFYNECLQPFGFRWFAAIGFFSGSALWAMAIQRTASEGPFESNDKRVLSELSDRLTEAATLSKAVGGAVLVGVTDALHLLTQPALILDRRGFVIQMNPAAEQVLDNEICIKNRRLFLFDQQARSALQRLTEQLHTTPDTAPLPADPIVIRRSAKRPLVVRILPINGAARSPFLGARALLVISDLDSVRVPHATTLMRAFDLSQAEARLAVMVATGASTERVAEELGIGRETVRSQLKAVFAKTATRRQGELVSLLSRL